MSDISHLLRDIDTNIQLVKSYDEQLQTILSGQEYDLENIIDLETKKVLEEYDLDDELISNEKIQELMDENFRLREELKNSINEEDYVQVVSDNQKMASENKKMEADYREALSHHEEVLGELKKSENLRKAMDAPKDLESLCQAEVDKVMIQHNEETPCEEIKLENMKLTEQVQRLNQVKTGSGCEFTEEENKKLQTQIEDMKKIIEDSDCLKSLEECKQKLDVLKEINGGVEPILIKDTSSISEFFEFKQNSLAMLQFTIPLSEIGAWKASEITEEQLIEKLQKVASGDISDTINLVRRFVGDNWYKMGQYALENQIEKVVSEISNSVNRFDYAKRTETEYGILDLLSSITKYALRKYQKFFPIMQMRNDLGKEEEKNAIATYMYDLHQSNKDVDSSQLYSFAKMQIKARKKLTNIGFDLITKPEDNRNIQEKGVEYDRKLGKDVEKITMRSDSHHKKKQAMQSFVTNSSEKENGALVLAATESIRIQIGKDNGMNLSKDWGIKRIVDLGKNMLEKIWKENTSSDLQFHQKVGSDLEFLNPFEKNFDFFKNSIDRDFYLNLTEPAILSSTIVPDVRIGDMLVTDIIDKINGIVPIIKVQPGHIPPPPPLPPLPQAPPLPLAPPQAPPLPLAPPLPQIRPPQARLPSPFPPSDKPLSKAERIAAKMAAGAAGTPGKLDMSALSKMAEAAAARRAKKAAEEVAAQT